MKIQYRNYSINIEYDEYAESPRTAYSNLGTIYANSQRYNPDNAFIGDYFDNGEGEIDWDLLERDYIWLRVYCYIHGGLSLWCVDKTKEPQIDPLGYMKYDTGFFGIIAISKEQARKEYGVLTKKTVARIEQVLKDEISELSDWYNGECYYYTVTDTNGNAINSLYGFIGDSGKEYAIEEAKDYIDCYIYQKTIQTELFSMVG